MSRSVGRRITLDLEPHPQCVARRIALDLEQRSVERRVGIDWYAERAMKLDARSVFAAAFMRARHADESLPAALAIARAMAAEVDRTSRFDLDRGMYELSLFDPREVADAPAPIGLADRRIFDVVRYALEDLHRIAEPLAHRNLGYAFHSLPELREPFERNLYAFSLRFVAFHWALLSSELKLALARMLDTEPAELEARVAVPGFASSMYR